MGLKQSKIIEDSRFNGPSDYDMYKKYVMIGLMMQDFAV